MRTFMLSLCLLALPLVAQAPRQGSLPTNHFDDRKPMDMPCVQSQLTLDENATATTPFFRIYHESRTAAVASDSGAQLVLQQWHEGAWIDVSAPTAKDREAVADVLVSAGYYRWLVIGQQPGGTLSLCMQMPLDNLIADFTGPDTKAADEAYFTLFQLGEAAIPLLLNLTEHPGDFSGGNIQHPHSSTLELTPPSVRCVALYLIDAVYWDNPRPHLRLTIFNTDQVEQKTTMDLAVDQYRNWWRENENLTLKALREQPHPLDNTSLYWLGPIQPHEHAHHKTEEDGNSNKVPNSDTPGTNPMVCLSTTTGPDPTNTDPYEWQLAPQNPGDPTPYNCLAWSLNCQTDRWIQPTSKVTLDDILEDYCYDTPSTEDAECPEGCGPKIKMVFFQPCEPENAPLQWVHAMKQEADGDWSSKNGQTCLYGDIKNCSDFINCYYPPPEGQKLVVKYYCKTKSDDKPDKPVDDETNNDETDPANGDTTTTGGGR